MKRTNNVSWKLHFYATNLQLWLRFCSKPNHYVVSQCIFWTNEALHLLLRESEMQGYGLGWMEHITHITYNTDKPQPMSCVWLSLGKISTLVKVRERVFVKMLKRKWHLKQVFRFFSKSAHNLTLIVLNLISPSFCYCPSVATQQENAKRKFYAKKDFIFGRSTLNNQIRISQTPETSC